MSTPHGAINRAAIVADDLTGASDTGVQFARAGWATYLELTQGGSPATSQGGRPTAVAVRTDSRALPVAEAARVTESAVTAQVRSGCDAVYVKIDSTMRGSVAAQLDGALAAWRVRHPDAFAVLCPAYPQMGRTCEDGRALVHGRPVTESPASRDPVTPVLTSALAELVPGATILPAATDPRVLAARLADAARSADRLVVEARTDEDLDVLARALALLGPRALPAGSAGLAQPVAASWLDGRLPGSSEHERLALRRLLVVVSSLHEVARSQVKTLAAAGHVDTEVHEPSLDVLLDPAVDPPRFAPGADVVTLVAPTDRGHADGTAALVARRLAAWTVASMSSGDYDGLVLVGGDGADAVLDALGAESVAIEEELLEGVPFGHVRGGSADGLPVATKAGGFGDDATLTTLISILRTPTELESTP